MEIKREYRGVSSSLKNKVKSSSSKLRGGGGEVKNSMDMLQDIKATKEAQRRQMAALQDREPACSMERRRSILLV